MYAGGADATFDCALLARGMCVEPSTVSSAVGCTGQYTQHPQVPKCALCTMTCGTGSVCVVQAVSVQVMYTCKRDYVRWNIKGSPHGQCTTRLRAVYTGSVLRGPLVTSAVGVVCGALQQQAASTSDGSVQPQPTATCA